MLVCVQTRAASIALPLATLTAAETDIRAAWEGSGEGGGGEGRGGGECAMTARPRHKQG